MNIGRVISWAFVALFALVPVNWFRLWLQGELSDSATPLALAIGVAICWGLAGFGAFMTVRKSREDKSGKPGNGKPLHNCRNSP